jgi:hypothetical protein
MQCRSSSGGVWSIRSHKNVTKLSEQVESVTQPRLDRSRSDPTLQYFTVTRSQLQRQQSHHPMKDITVIIVRVD